MCISSKTEDWPADLSANDLGGIAAPTRSMRRFRELIMLLCCSLTACSNGADPGSIEQLVRAALH
jgi:hypothetical protein